VTKPERDMKTR